MSAIALLMGLLVLSYVGSLLVGGRTRGLPSGIEFIGLGFIVGPNALELVDRRMISEFEPIIQIGLGWLAFVVGLDFGRAENRRVDRKAAALGIATALLTGGIVAFAVHRAVSALHVRVGDPLLFALGAGAVTAETARSGVDWMKARWMSKGPVTRLLRDIGAADDLAPLVVAGAIFAIAPKGDFAFALPAWGWFAASLALGGLLGLVTAMLLRGVEGDAVWGAVIGTLLLVVGTAGRFALCSIFVTFTMGIALAAGSSSRRALRKLVSPTERLVLYPMLLLAGARIDPRPLLEQRALLGVIAVALLARIGGKLVSGVLVRSQVPAARPAGGFLGIVLLSSGPVSTSCGLLLALRFPGALGDTLLVCAAASALVGEVVSTLALRALLVEAGEIAPPQAKSIPPPSGGSIPPRSGSMPPPKLGSIPPLPPPPKLGSIPPPAPSRYTLDEE